MKERESEGERMGWWSRRERGTKGGGEKERESGELRQRNGEGGMIRVRLG